MKKGSILGGTLLVAGTCIGGGMLALPVLTSLGGFVPSLVLYLICWGFMTCTGLLLLEVCQWMEGETNIVSMAEHTLGAAGKYATWGIYLFLFYCLTLAYIVGCANFLGQFISLPEWSNPLIFVTLFAPFVFAGAQVVGRINALFMFGLGIFYFAFVLLGFKHVNPELLMRKNWTLSLAALPIAFTSFGFQGIVPTLSNYMNHNINKTRVAIILGSFIPFITYIIWEWLILGIVPTDGPGGLAEALQHGDNAIKPLKNFINTPTVYIVGQYFAFFALSTSFFGVTLGFLDFLADGLKIKKTRKGKLLLSFLVFIPPLIIGMIYPNIFLEALDYAGGFGCALLLGLLPILMVWVGRYRMGLKSTGVLKGGRLLLLILLSFVVFEVGYELFLKIF